MASPPDLSAAVATLKEAFPDTDQEIIEIVLHEACGNTEIAFNQLLAMSDPSYNIGPTDVQPSPPPPPPPPQAPESLPQPALQEAYFQSSPQHPQNLTSTSASQLAADEALARALASEDLPVRPRVSQHNPQDTQDQFQQTPGPQFNFQEEFEPIKQKAIEGAQVARKKVLELYNQFKNRATPGVVPNVAPTNAQYRNLPGDEDFLSAEHDLSALRLSDNDVANRTTTQPPPTREERLAQQQAWINAQREREGFVVEDEDRLERRHSSSKGYQIDDVAPAVHPPVLPVASSAPKEPVKEVQLHATTVTDELIDDDEEEEEEKEREAIKTAVAHSSNT